MIPARVLKDSGEGSEGESGTTNAEHVGKPRHTAPTVATHFRAASVCVEKAPAEVYLLVILNQNEAISTHRDLSPTKAAGKLWGHLCCYCVGAVVNKDEVVAAAAHLIEVN
jgi:hypothetical protein